MSKITGLKKAVGDYHRANAGGYYSAEYGYLMLDRRTGHVWCDYYVSIGHNSWSVYNDDAIVDLGKLIVDNGDFVSMQSVRSYACRMCDDFACENG